jgi:hypothetical protein
MAYKYCLQLSIPLAHLLLLPVCCLQLTDSCQKLTKEKVNSVKENDSYEKYKEVDGNDLHCGTV